MSKLVLITGGTGYIGSHAAVEVLNEGYDVVIADNLSNSSKKSLLGIEKLTGKKTIFELVDFTDYQQVENLFKKYNFDAVMHFAAFKAVAESIEKPLMYYHNNLFSTINLLRAIKQTDNEIFFIFSSSCTVYGTPNYLPLDEKHPFNPPTSPYGYTKQLSEQILKDEVRELKGRLKVISLRYFNPIGAHHSGIIGESPKKMYNIIPILTEVANGKRDVLYIYGNDYPTPDGTPVRDYIHVEDLAKAHLIALNRLFNKTYKADYEYFNLGLGRGYSVLEIVKTFEQVIGKKINYKFAPRRPGDVAELYASTALANKELGWKAKYELKDMLQTAWNWELNKYY